MARKLSTVQTEARDLLYNGAIEYAAKRRREGAEYKDIENELKNSGVVDHNGRPFHNANLSAGVGKRFPELRTRTKKTKTVATSQVWASSANALRKLLTK